MTEALRAPDLATLLEHRAWVRALAGRLCRDENDVDDVEQETWSVAMRKRPGEPRALRSWLGVVASRLALQRIRGETRRARREEAAAEAEAAEPSTEDVVATADAHGHVVQAVLALEEPYKTTVLLRYFEGLEIAEVARRMDVPVETVRTRLKRAHERLRSSLGPDRDRMLAILVAPAAKAVTGGATVGAGAGYAAAAVAAVVVAGAGGAWFLTGATDDESEKNPVVAAAPPPPSVAPTAPGADGADGADGEPGKDGEAGQDAPAVVQVNSAPAPVAQDKPATPPAAGDPWRVYDLADGRPIPNLTLQLRTEGGKRDVRTDEAGDVRVEREPVTDVTAEGWTFAKPTQGAVKDEPSLWFWRDRPVTGSVASSDATKPLDPGAVRLTWHQSRWTGGATEPGRGMLWRIQHGLDPREERPVTVRVADDGRLSGTATAVRGALLVAEADGFTPAALPLAWNAEGVCDLRFSLRPSLRIVARVLDENGAPVAGDEVLLDTAIVTKDDDETARAMAMHPRGGVVYAGRAGQGTVGLIAREFTDARGIVRFDAPAVGVNVVRVLKPGYLVALREFTPDAKDAVGFDLRLARSEARVLVLDAGKPVASSGLMVCLEGGGQNGFQLSTDADGRMDPGWLERGRWYRTASGNWNVCFRWDGQTQIDLSELPKNPANK